jgi:hypothetical protein
VNWRAKSLIQNLVGTLPPALGDPVYHAIQGLHGLRPEMRQQLAFLTRFGQAMRRLTGRGFPGGSFVELGSGWFPVIPLFLLAGGAASVHTFDLRRHYSKSRIRMAAAALRASVPALRENAMLARVENSGALPDEVRYHPGAAIEEFRGLPAGSVDAAFSNTMLSCFEPGAVERIHRRSLDWIKDDGLWIHLIVRSGSCWGGRLTRAGQAWNAPAGRWRETRRWRSRGRQR